MNIRKVRQFEIYVNNRKAGTFSVDPTNTAKFLPPPGDCGGNN